ncbi:MAG: malate permease [Archaeoglobi archaeon]|nr:AEC family transporter [Candidatus Mnemosynella bozhongmuii]MDK2781588.1 malate permease [Archaeoglobi archaeon]
MIHEMLTMVLSILFGMVGRSLGIFRDEDGALLSRIVLLIFLPSMIILSMREIHREDLREMAVILLAGMAVLLLTLAISAIFSKFSFKRRKDAIPVFMLNSTFGNGGFMGVPIVFAIYGYEGVQRILFANLGFAFVFWTLGVYICALSSSERFSTKYALKELITNPPTVSTFLGLFLALLSIPIPEVLADLMRILGEATVPLSMIAIGIFIRLSSFRSYLFPSLLNGFFKFLISPLTAVLISEIMNLSELNSRILFLFALMPPAVLNTILASRYSLDTELSSAITVINTFMSIPLIFLILLFWSS